MSVYQSGDIIQDKYRIADILGKGGVAITYQAINLATKSNVAIKVISLKQLDNWKQIELFQREAEVLAQLNHRCIPQYIDYFDLETETDKAFYIVQQLAPGKSLFDLVESGWRTTEKEVKNIAEQILNILSYLHSLEPPVIHRDIKPNNLIRSDDGTIYLVDFGAVQNTYYNTLMQGSTVVGTYGYMAPEQFRGKALPTTDLYSLGATLLYLLTHRSPSELPQDTLKLDFRSSVKISDRFAEWLEKILEPDLDDRFTSAEVAKNQLIASNKVQPKKVVTGISVGVLCLALIWGFTSYKWFFLSRLGFSPQMKCSKDIMSDTFFVQGGNLNFIDTNSKIFILACIVQYKNYQTIRQVFLQTNNLTELINILDNRLLLFKKVIYKNDPKILELLIDLGANVNLQSKLQNTGILYSEEEPYNQTPLHIAAERRKNNAIEILIRNGANVNARNSYGQTPLFFATNSIIQSKSTDTMKLLIRNGANVNAKDNYGRNSLFETIGYRYEDIDAVKLLLKHGIDVNAKDKNNDTILHYAVYREKKEIAQLLIEYGANVKARNNDGETPLHNIYSVENKELVLLSIKSGADVNTRRSHGENPLFFAKNKDIATLLIEHGAKVNFKGYKGETSLWNAVTKNRFDIAKVLIDSGADINVKNKHGQTILSTSVLDSAVASKKTVAPKFEAVKFLIRHGADTQYLNPKTIAKVHQLDEREYLEVKQFIKRNKTKIDYEINKRSLYNSR